MPVQRIVGIGRDLTLPIHVGRQIAVVVVGVSLGIQEWILPRARTVHVAIGIDRLLALGIGHGEEITVGIVPELRHAVNRIGELRDPIQRIRSIDGLLAQRVDEAAQPPRRIEHPCGGPIQRIFHRDEIAEFIGDR